MTTIEKTEQIPFWVTREEADALLHILLHTSPAAMVTEEISERLLNRAAETTRAFDRLDDVSPTSSADAAITLSKGKDHEGSHRNGSDSGEVSPAKSASRLRSNRIRRISTAASPGVRLR